MSHVVKRVSTPEVIVQYLIGRIREGEFGPGDQLPSERELQIRLGVGRLSLREGHGPAMTDDEALVDLNYNFHPDTIQGVPDLL